MLQLRRPIQHFTHSCRTQMRRTSVHRLDSRCQEASGSGRLPSADFGSTKAVSAYGVWVSEIMCQQTRVEAVIPEVGLSKGFLAPHLVSFPCFLLVSLEHPLVSSGNSEPGWFGPQISQIGKIPGYFAGIPGKTPGIPEKPPDSLPISYILPQILPQTSSQTQGNSRESPEGNSRETE